MTMDTEMKIAYSAMLKQLQHELYGMDAKRQALQATIAGLERLMMMDEQPELTGLESPDTPSPAKLTVPPGFFREKTPTEAYRDLQKLWPGQYRPPEVADAFQEGGMVMQRSKLLQAIHSVMKRERARASRHGHSGNGNGSGAG